VLTNIASGNGQKLSFEHEEAAQSHSKNKGKSWLLSLLRSAPRGLRVFLMRSLMASSAGKRILRSWNFDWNDQ